MAIVRLNHAVLFVGDAERSARFYEDVLGFRRLDLLDAIPGAVFLQAQGSTNDHDLGLFSVGESGDRLPTGGRTVGLYHLAWEVDTLEELGRLAEKLKGAGALVGASDHGTTKSLYGRDLDGIEFEVQWMVPLDLLDTQALAASRIISPLDLESEKARYGPTTLGGVGKSSPASVAKPA
ncbi:MAG: VOC family protein [Acidimicrobiales bacterium]